MRAAARRKPGRLFCLWPCRRTTFLFPPVVAAAPRPHPVSGPRRPDRRSLGDGVCGSRIAFSFFFVVTSPLRGLRLRLRARARLPPRPGPCLPFCLPPCYPLPSSPTSARSRHLLLPSAVRVLTLPLPFVTSRRRAVVLPLLTSRSGCGAVPSRYHPVRSAVRSPLSVTSRGRCGAARQPPRGFRLYLSACPTLTLTLRDCRVRSPFPTVRPL